MDISWVRDMAPVIELSIIACFAVVCVLFSTYSQGKRNAILYAEEQAKNEKQMMSDSLDTQIQEPNERLAKDTCSCMHEVHCKFCSKMPTIRAAESSNTFNDKPYAEIECANCGILVTDNAGKNREDCVLNAIRKWNQMMQ